MARIPHLNVYQNDVPFEVTGVSFKAQSGRGTKIEVVPLFPAGRQPSELDEWDIELKYDTSREEGSEGPTGGWLVKSARISEGSLRQDLKRVSEAFTLVDRQYDFWEIAPLEKVTHRDTDLERELKFLVEQLGLEDFDTNIKDVAIARVDYTLDRPWMAGVAPYVDPFEPYVYIHPVDQILKIYDPGRAMELARTITPDHATAADFTPSPYDIVTRVKLISIPFGGAPGSGEERFTGRVERVTTDPSHTPIEGGGEVVSWQTYDKLFEDPDDDTKFRVVNRGSVAETYRDSFGLRSLAVRNTTEMLYLDDYTLVKTTTKTTDGLVDLPGIGRRFENNVDVEVQETEWVRDDPDAPRKARPKTRKTTKRGIVLYSGDNGVAGDQTAVQASVATLNGAVDTRADSHQRFEENYLISTVMEVFTPAGDRAQLNVNTTTMNWLRGVAGPTYGTTPITRDSVSADVQPKIEYLPTTHLSGFRPRAARVVDATTIGREWGVYIAERILARTGGVLRRLPLKMLWPDPTYSVGQAVGVSGFSWNRDGAYVIESIDITAQAAKGQNKPEFKQILNLVSP